jgi:carotenoid 1,2-hydratase
VVVEPELMADGAFALDPEGRHHWRGIAPRARISVTMKRPELSWAGSGYFDCNWGSEPLEDGFADWQWSRAHCGREAAVLYEGVRRDGSRFAAALRFDASGRAHEEELPMGAPLPRTWWMMERRTRADRGHASVGQDLGGFALLRPHRATHPAVRPRGDGGARKPVAEPVPDADRAGDAAL